MKSGENEKMYPKIVPHNAGMWTVARDSQAHTHAEIQGAEHMAFFTQK